MADPAPAILHASAVAFGGRGLLIRGASGSGKSFLALQLLALGADLVSDDRTVLAPDGDALSLDAPEAIRGLIEARGIGLLARPSVAARLCAVLDLDTPEAERLPPRRETVLLERRVPLLHNVAHPAFPAALQQYMTHARYA